MNSNLPIRCSCRVDAVVVIMSEWVSVVGSWKIVTTLLWILVTSGCHHRCHPQTDCLPLWRHSTVCRHTSVHETGMLHATPFCDTYSAMIHTLHISVSVLWVCSIQKTTSETSFRSVISAESRYLAGLLTILAKSIANNDTDTMRWKYCRYQYRYF